jgi:NADH:ubiquinone oxidoreductase subunit D
MIERRRLRPPSFSRRKKMKYIQYDPAEFDKITVVKADDVDALKARIAELEAALKAVVDDATGYKHPGLNVRQVSFDAIDAARAAYLGAKK